MSPNDAGHTALSARTKATQTCIYGLLEQTLHHKEPSLSCAVQWETGMVMKGEPMLWPLVEVSIPRLGQSYRTLVSVPWGRPASLLYPPWVSLCRHLLLPLWGHCDRFHSFCVAWRYQPKGTRRISKFRRTPLQSHVHGEVCLHERLLFFFFSWCAQRRDIGSWWPCFSPHFSFTHRGEQDWAGTLETWAELNEQMQWAEEVAGDARHLWRAVSPETHSEPCATFPKDSAATPGEQNQGSSLIQTASCLFYYLFDSKGFILSWN